MGEWINMIDYPTLKNTLVTLAQNYIFPKITDGDMVIHFGDYYNNVKQAFYPLSSSLSGVSINVTSIWGDPDDLVVRLLDSNKNTIVSSTIDATVGWNKVVWNVNIVSKNKYYLEISNPGCSTLHHYELGGSTTAIHEDETYINDWSTTFTIRPMFYLNITNIIQTAYPGGSVPIDFYPKVVVDLSSKPLIFQRYLDPKTIEEMVSATYTIYSKYPSEIDFIARRLERALFRERMSITGVFNVMPGGISPITLYRENVYQRSVSFNLRQFLRIE